METAFDSQKYIAAQKEEIMKKVLSYDKLYFELGGKLLDDHHASRVLPGFLPDTKMQIMQDFKDICEFVICVNSKNIQDGRIRSDYNTLYTDDCLKLIKTYRDMGFDVSSVCLTLFDNQPKAFEFKNLLESMGEKVYISRFAKNYPHDEQSAMQAFDESDYIETTKPLVVMTSSGSASGKLSACLSQIYNEYKHGNRVGYAKYDIFPVWDLPIAHPINLAFRAATADSNDRIMEDTYYYQMYKKVVSNYNRDLLVFPIIRKVLSLANGGVEPYSSPTEMVINKMSESITNEELINQKCYEEICRRYLTYKKQHIRNQSDKEPIERVKKLMDENGITMDCLEIVKIAQSAFEKNPNKQMAVLKLPNGQVLEIEKRKNSDLCTDMLIELINSCGIPLDKTQKIDLNYIMNFLNSFDMVDDLYRTLNGSDMHTSNVISLSEERDIKSFGVNLTCEPISQEEFESRAAKQKS